MDMINTIDFTFFDGVDRKYITTVLIILNRPILKKMYQEIRPKVDYVICADGAANRMFDDIGSDK